MSASRNGYIGRAPADSSVIIARKTYEPTGVQTDFTFAAGYTPGYCDVYLNGVKLIDATDYSATNGSTVGLTSAAASGDVVEVVAYKAFNLGIPLSNITGNLDVTGNISASSSITADGAFYGDGSNLSGVAGAAITQYISANSLAVLGSPGVSTITRLGATDLSVTGIITANGLSGNVTGAACTFTTGTFNGNVTIGGTLTYEDVTNVDALGIITARAGVNVSGGEFKVGTALTIGSAGVATALGFVAGTSGLSGTLQTAAQTNITSLGTLTGLTVSGDATLTGDSYSVVWDKSDNALEFGDNAKIKVGSGDDLNIYHDGNSYITNAVANQLAIQSDDLKLRSYTGTEKYLTGTVNEGVEIYYNDSKKFETTNDGTVTTGICTATDFSGASGGSADFPNGLSLADNKVARFGNDGDMQIYHTGSQSHVSDRGGVGDLNLESNNQVNIKQNDASHYMARFNQGGSSELYYNNSKKLETTNNGTVTTGVSTVSNVRYSSSGGVNNWNGHPRSVVLGYSGSDYAQIGMGWTTTGTNGQYVSGNTDKQSRLELQDGLTIFGSGASVASGTQVTWKEVADFKPGGITLYGDGDQSFYIGSNRDISIYGSAAGITSVTWDASANSLIFNDNSKAIFGTGSDGVEIYHDGSHSRIVDSGTGGLKLQSSALAIDNAAGTETMAAFTADGSVQLRYNNSTKIETNNDGVVITGIATVSQGLNTDGLLSEKFETTAGKLSDNTNIDLEDGMVHYFSTQETTTSTPNIRYSSSKSLNNMLSTGDSITVTIITTAGANGYSANMNIDGSGQTEEWIGGSAPSAGGSDGHDIYSYTILKTGSSSYKVIANVVNATN